MAASDLPLSPAAATSNTGSNANATTANLNVRNLRVQHNKDHDRAVDRKLVGASEPQHHCDKSSQHVRRRKRDVFFSLFKHSSSSKRDLATQQPATQSVPVQIPVGYTNPNHKGCLVSGRRVAYSRHMHHGRKAALATTLEHAIPEDEQVLEFSPTKLQLEQAQEESSRTQRAVARSYSFL